MRKNEYASGEIRESASATVFVLPGLKWISSRSPIVWLHRIVGQELTQFEKAIP